MKRTISDRVTQVTADTGSTVYISSLHAASYVSIFPSLAKSKSEKAPFASK